ncbi:hypothetical protein BBJ28_00017721 [Nothophytophthora sp. Chile5]|nr:hypothetical protein BBJ28_00017721 [Nothophytophthora sp. Chile5]
MEDESAGHSPDRDADRALAADGSPVSASRAALAAIARSNAGGREALAALSIPNPRELIVPEEASAVAMKQADAEETKDEAERQVDESEVFFLIADFLKRHSTCQKTADTLITEMEELQLLKGGVDWRGEPKPATYDDYRLRHRDLAPGHLVDLLRSATATFQSPTTHFSSPKKTKMGLGEHATLLLKSRVSKKLQLPENERRKLAKDIVAELFALRAVLKTQRVVEKVIKKYERLQQYTTAVSVDQLPAELQQLMLSGNEPEVKTEGPTDKVTALAADVRALKQLFQLRQERTGLEKRIDGLMDRAKSSALFQTTKRTGRNQMSLLQRREVSSQREPQLPPAMCTGDLLFSLRGHVGNITDLAVNASNTLLASSSDDKSVRVWELSTGAPVAVLLGHLSIVNSVRFHPTKNVVVTASDDGRCYCYKLPDIPRVDEPETKIQTARRLFALKAYMLSLQPTYSLSHAAHRQGARSCKVLCLAFSRCGDFVITGGQDGIARVWDVSVLSDPDAPAVVPRFQPTDEPQEQPAGGNGQALEPLRVAITPPIAAPVTQVPAIAPADAQNQPQQQQQPATQAGNDTVPTVTEPLPAVVAPTQSLLLDQTLLPQVPAPAPQDGVETPLPTIAQALQREVEPQQSQLPQLPQHGLPSVALSDNDVPRLPAPNSEPIALLKGHTGPITNIVYSNVGDQVATASIKDGTTRIWRWKKKYKKLHGTVLFAKEAVENDDIPAFYGVQGRRKAVPAVDTLTWTRNDKRLITLHSVKPDSHSMDSNWEQRIRIWDPAVGQLVMTLGAIDKEKKVGHVNAVFAMDVHPTDWRIVVTAGYDGRVFLWDISTGRMLKSFTNLSPESKVVPMLDGGFMPDGNGFCFTDQIGRLLIFGTGSGEQYAATPVQQYFHRDYAVLITDRNLNVLDRETGMLPSRMASGPLMDIYRIEYPHQPPHLMRNGELLTPEQYEENRRLRVEQCKESEIKCRVQHLPENEEEVHSFPLAIVKSGQGQSDQPQGNRPSDMVALSSASYRLNGAPVMLSELRRRGFGSRRYGQRRQAPVEERDTSVLELEISSDDDRSDEDFQVPTPRNAGGAEEEEDDDEDDDDDDDDDDEELDEDDFLSDNDESVISPAHFRRRRLRSARPQQFPRPRFPTRGGRTLQSASERVRDRDETPRQLRARRNAARTSSRLVIDSEGEDEASDRELPLEQREDETGEEPSGRIESQEQVVVESNDGFIMGDNQLDKFDQSLTYAQMLETKRTQLGTTRDNMATEDGEEALIPCAFCGVGDDGAMLKLPGDGMGVHPLIYGTQRLFVHDQCAIASPLCFNRGGSWYNVTKEIRRGRSLNCVGCHKRGATVGCTVPSCRNSYHWKCAINCGWSMDQIQFFCPDHQSMRAQRDREEDTETVEDGVARPEPVAKRFGLTFHREWLQLVSLVTIHQYVPQVGDYVVYLPEGHEGYLRFGGHRKPSYYGRLSKFYAVKCRVVDVKYVFPLADEFLKCSTIKCEISLAVLAVPSSAVRSTGDADEEHKQGEEEPDAGVAAGDDTNPSLFNPESSRFAEFTSVNDQLAPTTSEPSTRFSFKMLYHSNDVANFLVLDHVYDSGVCGNWRVGDRVQMPYVQLDAHGYEIESKMSYGAIASITPKPLASNRAPRSLSPWECIEVEWDSADDETCCVCPWELEPALVDKLREKRERALRSLSTRLYLSRCIIGGKRDALLQEINQIMTLSISRDFMYPVDESFLDYLITIANPIDLTKIQQRLRLGYYRQVEAFLADAKLLYQNCESYNVQSSTIAQNSRNLFSSLLTQAQRHFPHLLRDDSSDNQQSGGERATRGSFTYPPEDFVSSFPEESEETQLAVLDGGLLRATLDGASAESPAVAAAASPEVAPRRVSLVRAASTRMNTRRSRSSEEGKENEADEETKEQSVAEQDETADGDAALSPAPMTSRNRVEEVKPIRVSSQSSAQEGESEREMRSPRVRRTTRVVTTPSPGEGGSARKRQRTNPELELLTYSVLLDNLTSAQREDVKNACDEDLKAVLQDFHEALVQADKSDIFAVPVTDDVAPDYSLIIKNPQDFGSMMDALTRYKSLREYFVSVVWVC